MIITLKPYDAKKLKEHEKIYGEMSYIYKNYIIRCHSSYCDRWLFMSPDNGHRLYGSSNDNAKKEVMHFAEKYFQKYSI